MATIRDSANWASHQAYPSDKSMTYEQMELQARLRLAFQKGARWRKMRIMEDAVEGKVNQDGFLELSNGEVIDICPTLKRCALGLHIGDKVRIIVMKEEEQQ